MVPDYEMYLKDTVDVLFKPWPQNRTVNLVFHGHSVPAGYMATPVVDTFSAYPYQLLARLKERFVFAVINVIITAIGGENSRDGAARFERDVLCHRPDVITIDYGLNDRVIGLAAAEKAWREMTEKALARQVKVILLTPTHDLLTLRTGEPLWSEELPRHAEQIRRLADEYQIALVDSHAAFSRYIADGGHISDLLSHINHPNRAGHQLVVKELLRWFPPQ